MDGLQKRRGNKWGDVGDQPDQGGMRAQYIQV